VLTVLVRRVKHGDNASADIAAPLVCLTTITTPRTSVNMTVSHTAVSSSLASPSDRLRGLKTHWTCDSHVGHTPCGRSTCAVPQLWFTHADLLTMRMLLLGYRKNLTTQVWFQAGDYYPLAITSILPIGPARLPNGYQECETERQWKIHVSMPDV
jgi:hypothetical protein